MSPPGGFPAGALVVLEGLGEKLTPVIGRGGPVDCNGAKAQLVERRGTEWLAVTFGGVAVTVGEQCCRLLTAEELDGYDLIMGPSSNTAEMAKQMAGCLLEKGFLTTHVLLGEPQRKELLSAARSLEEAGAFMRLPMNFEAGYLGKGGKAKVALLEDVGADSAAELMGSVLPAQDSTITMFSEALQPHMQESFGFDIYSRTNLMLRLSFADLEDEARHVPPPAQPKEADAFLALMGRKRMTVLHFLGPASGELRLLPKAPDFAEVTLLAEPGCMVMLLADQYDYKYEAAGESLTLQAFFLSEPLEFEFSGMGGNLELLADQSIPAGAPPPAGESVVVKGLASRDPCGVDKDEQLWAALRHAGTDGALEIPHSRFDIDLYIDYEDQVRAVTTGKSYCRHQGYIEGIDIFDSTFFNVPEQEAYGMDPCQRLVLETGWMALANSGGDRKTIQKDGAHLGVFVGISGSEWQGVCQQPSANGIPETFIANRFSYLINLKGPSQVLNTACSASLVACHSAKSHLIVPHDALDGCVVTGVALPVAAGTWIATCQSNMFSFVGRCFTFNASADGYLRGEGCASMVMKRGAYDHQDPTTYAMLAGTHANSDGRSASLTAPNGPAQQRLLRAILSETQLQSAEICVYEAHGTGTSLGDPIELGAVKKVFNQRAYPLQLSCAKTNMGHLEGGAGMSSFCKVCMSVMHCETIPNQHLRALSGHLDLDGWPTFIVTEGVTMKADTTYVGVSGFGYGGTNAHALCYGKNVLTSRGGTAKFAEVAIMKKLKSSPVPDIWMEGDNYEEWVTSGVPHLAAASGKNFVIELLPNGKSVWREAVEPDMPDSLTAFQIQGSFNMWSTVSLQPSDEVAGLHAFELTLGSSGQETFQIVVDHDPDLCLYPEETLCSRKTVKVVGPEAPPSRDHAWLIRGSAGTRYRVELFYPHGGVRSITWYPADRAPPETKAIMPEEDEEDKGGMLAVEAPAAPSEQPASNERDMISE